MLGSTIKTLRENRDVSQTDFYQGLISKRQAIRFEQDEADVKATVLVDILGRLDMGVEELANLADLKEADLPYHDFQKLVALSKKRQKAAPGLRSFYSKYRYSKNKQLRRMAIIAILQFDEPLEEADAKLLMDELFRTDELTVDQFKLFLQNIAKFAEYDQQEIIDKLSESFETIASYDDTDKLVGDYFDVLASYYLIDKQELSKAKRLVKSWGEMIERYPDEKVAYENWQLLLQLAETKDTSIHEDISKRAQLILLLEGSKKADYFINERRLVEITNGITHVWSTGEIGMVARRLNDLPKGETNAAKEILNSYQGLVAAVQKSGQPISSFLNDYNY